MTNSLLALNGCMFAAQALSGGAVTRWGIKVSSRYAHRVTTTAVAAVLNCAVSKLGMVFAQLFLNAEQCSYLSRAVVATNHSSIFAFEPVSSCG
jgi:hypothetical protein